MVAFFFAHRVFHVVFGMPALSWSFCLFVGLLSHPMAASQPPTLSFPNLYPTVVWEESFFFLSSRRLDDVRDLRVTGDSTFQSCDINPAPDAAQASRRRQRVAHHSHHFDHCKCRDDGDHYCTCAFCFRRRQSPYMGFANVDDGAPATSVPKEWW